MKLEQLNITDLMKLCIVTKHEPLGNSAMCWYYELYDGKWSAIYLTSCCMSLNPVFVVAPDYENPFERFEYIINKLLDK